MIFSCKKLIIRNTGNIKALSGIKVFICKMVDAIGNFFSPKEHHILQIVFSKTVDIIYIFLSSLFLQAAQTFEVHVFSHAKFKHFFESTHVFIILVVLD
jgi:hypothetical protein